MTKKWFQFAIRDLKAAKALVDLGTEHKHAAAYNAQQCAEKAIKGYITFCNSRVPKTHDLEVLGKLVESFDPRLAKLILKHKSLSDLAVNFRYPDSEERPLTLARTKTAARSAHLLYDSCFRSVYGKSDRSKFLKTFKLE